MLAGKPGSRFTGRDLAVAHVLAWTAAVVAGTGERRALAATPPTVTIVSPTAGTVALETLAASNHVANVSVFANVQAGSAAVVSAQATVGNTTTNLASSAGSWTGTVDVAGDGYGDLNVVVTATDTDGVIGTATASVYHAPGLLTSPAMDGLTSRGSLQVGATCLSDGGPGCTMNASFFWFGADHAFNQTALATDASAIDLTTDISSLSGRYVNFNFEQMVPTPDAGLEGWNGQDGVYVEATASLIDEATVNGPILDFDSGHILYLRNDLAVLLHDRTTGDETVVCPALQFNYNPGTLTFTASTKLKGWVTAHGAIVAHDVAQHAVIEELRDGTLSTLETNLTQDELYGGGASPADVVQVFVAGSFAAWSSVSANAILLRDLDTGVVSRIADLCSTFTDPEGSGQLCYRLTGVRDTGEVLMFSEPTTFTSSRVGGNGPPVYPARPGQAGIWTAQGPEVVVQDATWPAGDPSTMVFYTFDGSLEQLGNFTGEFGLALRTATGTVDVSGCPAGTPYCIGDSPYVYQGSFDELLQGAPLDDSEFGVAGGWAAWTQMDQPDGAPLFTQVFRCSPTGSIEQISDGTALATFDAINDAGEVMFHTNTWDANGFTSSPLTVRYLSRPGVPGLQTVGTGLGRPIYRDGSWHIQLGNMLLGVPGTGPDGGVDGGDAGSDAETSAEGASSGDDASVEAGDANVLDAADDGPVDATIEAGTQGADASEGGMDASAAGSAVSHGGCACSLSRRCDASGGWVIALGVTATLLANRRRRRTRRPAR